MTGLIMAKKIEFSGYDVQVSDRGELSVKKSTINTSVEGDYGADPLGDGTFRMIPSGDIVDFEERCRRLKK